MKAGKRNKLKIKILRVKQNPRGTTKYTKGRGARELTPLRAALRRAGANSREFLNEDQVGTTERTEEHGNGGYFASLGVLLCAFALKQFAVHSVGDGMSGEFL
jgi:hypothetical protein